MRDEIVTVIFILRITITTKGKYTAINEGKAIQPLVDLVDDSVSEVRLNAIKVRSILVKSINTKLKTLLFSMLKCLMHAWSVCRKHILRKTTFSKILDKSYTESSKLAYEKIQSVVYFNLRACRWFSFFKKKGGGL